MKTNYYVFLLLFFSLLAISGCAQYGGKQPETAVSETDTATGSTVEIASSGFSPRTLTVKSGETITFVNKDSTKHWPASNIHPTHTQYPESSGCIGSKFDACKGLAQREEFQFTFNELGSWDYHDHLNPNLIGVIVVE